MEQILSHGSLPKQAELNPDKGVKDFVARQPDPMRMCPDIPSRGDMSGRSGWMPKVVESPVRKDFFNAGAR